MRRHARAHRRPHIAARHRAGRVLESDAQALRDRDPFLERAPDDDREFLAAEPGDEIAGPHAALRQRSEQPEDVVADRMTETVVDRLEVIEVEDQHRDRLGAVRGLAGEFARGLDQAATVEQPGERVGQRRGLVHAQRPLLGQDQHDEGGADRVEQHLEDEDRDPAGRQRDQAALVRHETRERDRKQEHRAVQRRHEQRRPAPHQRLAPLAPQLGRGQEGVGRDDERSEHDAAGAHLREARQRAGRHPRSRARHHGEPENVAAMEQAGGVPDHAAGDEQQGGGQACRHDGDRMRVRAPQRDRESADQVGGAPPGERTNAILGPGEQQEDAQERGDAGGDDKQCPDVQRNCKRDAVSEHAFAPTRASR